MQNRRRRKWRFPRQVRLAITCATLLLIIFGIVMFARGCSKKPTEAFIPTQTSSETEEPQDSAKDSTNDAGTVQDSTDDIDTDATPEPEERTPARSVTIRSIGDIVISQTLLEIAHVQGGSYDFWPFFHASAEAMAKADYTVLNVDGPLGGPTGSRGYKGYPQFNTPPDLLPVLKEYGVDMLTLSNNHALDTYFDGLKRTIDKVEQAGFDHIGAYRSYEEFNTPYVKEIGGVKIGFLNYTTGTNGLEDVSDADAKVYGLRYTNNTDAGRDIQDLRDAGAEAVVIYMHWGKEYEREPSTDIRNMARRLASYGADVIVGGHPHVVQPCEWITTVDGNGNNRRTLVLYSMGNFFTDHRIQYTDSGIIFEFTLVSNEETGKIDVMSPRCVPIYVWKTGDRYQVIPIGNYIDNRPSNMDDANFSRMKEALMEIKEIIGDIVVVERN